MSRIGRSNDASHRAPRAGGREALLLDAAVARAWELGASRVYVNTCTKDHPAALPNYLARGFGVVREETR